MMSCHTLSQVEQAVGGGELCHINYYGRSLLRMQELSKADHRVLRGSVIEMVLGTDMKRHFNILSRFQVSLSPQRLSFDC